MRRHRRAGREERVYRAVVSRRWKRGQRLSQFVKKFTRKRSPLRARVSGENLMDGNGDAGFNFLGEADDVPVSETNATVADGAADGFRFVRAVNPDAFFVQRNPDHADGTVRTGR